MFAGASLTADCLSSEKREETLGFLFLTDLKGYDVVLGKLSATSVRSIYGLLATFPIMSLPLLLGGVRAGEFWRVVLAILNALLLSMSVGLLISTLFRRQRVTTHLATFIMLLTAFVPIGAGVLIKSVGGPTRWFLDPDLFSPVHTVQAAFDATYRMASLTGAGFWGALLAQFVVAILLLARASWLLPRSWQYAAAPAPAARDTSASASAVHSELVASRRRVLEENPFYWLASRGRVITLGMALLVGLVGFWGLQALDNREDFAAVQGVGILLVSLVTRLLIAYVSAQRLAEDKQSGALDLIITTPITVREILMGQWKAIWTKLGGPFLGSLALYVFLIFGGSPSGGIAGSDEALVRLFTAGAFFILTFTDAVALGWLGMWTGLRIRQVPHAAALTLCRVVLPPAIVPAAFVWNHGVTSADEYLRTNPYLIPALWLVLGLVNDWIWTTWARRKLFSEFRLAATDRFRRTDRAPGRKDPLPHLRWKQVL